MSVVRTLPKRAVILEQSGKLQQAAGLLRQLRGAVPPLTALLDCSVLLMGFSLIHGITGWGTLPMDVAALLFAGAIFLTPGLFYQVTFAVLLAFGWGAWSNTPSGDLLLGFALQFCLFQAFNSFRERVDELTAARSIVLAFTAGWALSNRGFIVESPLTAGLTAFLTLSLLMILVGARLALAHGTPKLSRNHGARLRTSAATHRSKAAFA